MGAGDCRVNCSGALTLWMSWQVLGSCKLCCCSTVCSGKQAPVPLRIRVCKLANVTQAASACSSRACKA